MSPSAKVLAIFGLAAFLSGSIYSDYSAWVDSLYRANNEIKAESEAFLSPSHNRATAEQVWDAENVRLGKYSDRNRLLFCFSFPLAMTFALLISWGAGWLPRFPFPRVIGALIPIYVIPWLLLALVAVSRGLLLIPAVILAAYLLIFSIAVLTPHRPRRFVLSLVLFTLFCSFLYMEAGGMLGKSAEPFAQALFIIANEVGAAVLYAKALLPLPSS